MGAVRPSLPKLPKAELTDPCTPASKHHFQLLQRSEPLGGRIGQYTLLLRCLHCANSVYVITKPATAALKKPPTKKERQAWSRLDKRQSVA